MTKGEVFDITIIGAGPVGLFTAFYAGMREASVKVIDSMPEVGGQLAALYPDKYIYDVGGFPKVKAKDLVSQLHEQAKTFTPTICLNESVKEVHQLEGGTLQLSTTTSTHYTKTIIITAGAGAFQPRKLKLDNASEFEDKTLHYFVQDLDYFKDRRVLLCGGGDSAVDWALALEPLAKEVTLIHRRNQFRAHEHSLTLLEQSNVAIHTPYEIEELQGNGGLIEQVIIKEVKGNHEEIITIDDVIVNFGFITNIGPIKSWGLETSKNAVNVNMQMETNIPGIYAAGDICNYEGKPKLIATGFGEATIAVNHAKKYMDPKAKISAHSTHLME
ncbi:NAD(P)/FAD-dependent oxidoreductase [Ornithinibacillus halophilus]|uniref:Ferredoxin--NADP reductase n=1 Tax=Ornithinibacillus halophilus TaxID=930117 RepID=A0A1M5GB32_9BACI|nr:NAD(P)/FAD-dependent oxidoreductase [Ornithinibacillus halophilus]SHG00967.1 thioredoxin reductase (NADPH) [Ornithinibacillus halophilus]